MATKKSSTLNVIGKGILVTLETFFSSLDSKLTEKANEFMKNIEKKAIMIEKTLLTNLINYIIILLGIIFLFFSLFYFLKEYLNLSRTLIYLIFGVLFLVIGILRVQFMKGGKN